MKSKDILRHERLPGVEIALYDVGPELAREWLDLNTANQRNISLPSVERYAADMITHTWAFTGAPILFNRAGELIDGQHRLNAIVDSDENQILLVINGLDESVMQAIDMGRRRSFADVLKMRKVKNAVSVAAIVSRMWHWENGSYGVRGVGRQSNAKHLSSTPSPAQLSELMAGLEKELGVTMEQAGIAACRIHGIAPRGIQTSTYGVAWLVLTRIDVDLREQFFHEFLTEPKYTSIEYPVNALRHRLSRLGTDRLDSAQQLHFIFLTFNAWMEGRPLTMLRKAAPPRWDTLAQPIDALK